MFLFTILKRKKRKKKNLQFDSIFSKTVFFFGAFSLVSVNMSTDFFVILSNAALRRSNLEPLFNSFTMDIIAFCC